jgi:hypothetical protein
VQQQQRVAKPRLAGLLGAELRALGGTRDEFHFRDKKINFKKVSRVS